METDKEEETDSMAVQPVPNYTTHPTLLFPRLFAPREATKPETFSGLEISCERRDGPEICRRTNSPSEPNLCTLESSMPKSPLHGGIGSIVLKGLPGMTSV